jgi:hypothetical protein
MRSGADGAAGFLGLVVADGRRVLRGENGHVRLPGTIGRNAQGGVVVESAPGAAFEMPGIAYGPSVQTGPCP